MRSLPARAAPRLRIAIGALLAAGLALAATARGVQRLESDAVPVPRLAIVYVEPNTGVASAGHLGLFVGQDIYHYQRTLRGWFLLRRDSWNGFRSAYGRLQNRGLERAWVEASGQVVEQVRHHVETLLAMQQSDLARWQRMSQDVAWLAGLTGNGPVPRLAAAGLFGVGPDEDSLGRRLRQVILERAPQRELEGRLAALRIKIRDTFQPLGRPQDLESFREDLQERLALRVILEARGLDPTLLHTPPDKAPLTREERTAIERFSNGLAQSVIRLLGSPRPDRGRAVLVAAARWHALQTSLQRGYLTLPDSFPDDCVDREPESGEPQHSKVVLEHRAAHAWRQARHTLLRQGRLDEASWNLLEDVATRLDEARRAARGLAWRHSEGRHAPSRGRVVDLPSPGRDLSPALERLRADLDRLEDRFDRYYAYDLISRNCVTQLAGVLRSSLAETQVARSAFGGEIPESGPSRFIPWFFFSRVVRDWRIAAVEDLPSCRQEKLAGMRRREPDLVVMLREASTWTASSYTPGARDGYFLFFTDGSPVIRPLLGLANLLYGTALTVAGAPLALFDGGDLLRGGLSGALYSLPELVGLNIRKGTYEPDATDWR